MASNDFTTEGWAIILAETKAGPDTRPTAKRMCLTGAPPIAGHDGSIWQIYTNEKDARDWLRIKFSDARYEVVKVTIKPSS